MNGIFLVNKQYGLSTGNIIYKLKKNLNITEKIGHSGVLDRPASGLVIILVGKMTKFFNYFNGMKKTYKFKFILGFETDSYDLTGNITRTNLNKNINYSTMEQIINKYKKFSYQQIPPAFSNRKFNGQKSYQYFFKNHSINMTKLSKIVNIYDIKLIHFEHNVGEVLITCSSGFYIRSFSIEIGRILRTYATVCNIERVKIGKYMNSDSKKTDLINLSDMIDIDEIFNFSNVEYDDIEKQLSKSNKIKFSNSNKYNDYIKIKSNSSFYIYKKIDSKNEYKFITII